MAKSTGNVITISEVAARGHDPLAFRYLCFTARYRRQVHFSEDALKAAGTALRRLREQAAALTGDGEGARTDADLRTVVIDAAALAHHDRFVAAIDDDLDFPEALKVVHEAIADARIAPDDRRRMLASWDNVLGLELVRDGELPAELQAIVADRERARAGGDYARADTLRDELRDKGVKLLDSPSGTRWVRR
jgi:cysteinyl-tRNA synthetase